MLSITLLIVWAAALAVYDWRWRRLPNWLLVDGVIVGTVHWAALGVMPCGTTLGAGALAAATALVALWPLYRLGWMGAGDVKLTAAVGWLGGWQGLVSVFLAGTLVGGAFGLALLVPRLADYMSDRGLEQRLRRRIPLGSGLAGAFIAWTAFRVWLGQVP